MKILFVNQSDATVPPPPNLIRADTYISVPLAEQMMAKGHDVTFLSTMGSKVKTKQIFTRTPPLLSVITPQEYYHIPDPALRLKLWWTFHFDLYSRLVEATKQESFDIVHIHANSPLLELVAAMHITAPLVFTLHDIPVNRELENRVLKLFNMKNPIFISISDYQRKSFPAFSFTQTIYHGLDMKKFLFDPHGGNNLIFAGRLKKIKGIAEAIQVALRTNKKLAITGTKSYPDIAFYNSQIVPVLEANKELLHFSGSIDRTNIEEFYQKGKTILIPILWEEPFGLTMIEAMACGTPVIAFARGSVPELIKDGVTGFIVNPSDKDIRGNFIIKKTGIDGLCEAVNRIYSLSAQEYGQMRENCRKHIEEHFTLDRMVDQYEEVYKIVLHIN